MDLHSLNGGNYISGEPGMSLIVKAMEQLEINTFFQCDNVMFRELLVEVGQLQLRMGDSKEKQKDINGKTVYRKPIHL